MSYSRWKDEQFWPAFRNALKHEHPQLTDESLDRAREFNDKRYYYQGIGRFAPAAAYARGIADLQILADLIPMGSYVFGAKPTSVDASLHSKSVDGSPLGSNLTAVSVVCRKFSWGEATFPPSLDHFIGTHKN